MRADGRPYAEEAAEAQRISNGEIEWEENKVAAMNLVPDEYRGLDRMEARERVVAAITVEGNAVMIPNPKAGDDGEADLIPHVENKPIMQPFGDRSKVVIEPMLTDQWFVETAKIVGPALDAVRDGTVQIIPESGEKTYYHWLENIEPWCISRQLWWGHQVPVGMATRWSSQQVGRFPKSLLAPIQNNVKPGKQSKHTRLREGNNGSKQRFTTVSRLS